MGRRMGAMRSKPSDLGYSDDGFVLPDLTTHRHMVPADRSALTGQEKDGQDGCSGCRTLRQRRSIPKAADHRRPPDLIAEKVAAEPDEAWVIWCDTDYEADALNGSDPRVSRSADPCRPMKGRTHRGVFVGRRRILITKPSVCGFGLNWQHCARMAFVGLSFSYESYYQAIRRCWRFGQGPRGARPCGLRRHRRKHLADGQPQGRRPRRHEGPMQAMSRAAGKALRADPTPRTPLPPFPMDCRMTSVLDQHVGENSPSTTPTASSSPRRLPGGLSTSPFIPRPSRICLSIRTASATWATSRMRPSSRPSTRTL